MEISFERAAELVLLCGTWFPLLVATRRQLTIQYLHRQFFARFAARKVYPGSLPVILQYSGTDDGDGCRFPATGLSARAGTEAGVIFEEVACDTLRLQLRC